MIESHLLMLVLSLAAGAGLGLFYFGGLWLTVRHLPTARRPELLSLGSFVGRLGVTLLGLYFVADGGWERLAASLVGFFVMRSILVHRLGSKGRNLDEVKDL